MGTRDQVDNQFDLRMSEVLSAERERQITTVALTLSEFIIGLGPNPRSRANKLITVTANDSSFGLDSTGGTLSTLHAIANNNEELLKYVEKDLKHAQHLCGVLETALATETGSSSKWSRLLSQLALAAFVAVGTLWNGADFATMVYGTGVNLLTIKAGNLVAPPARGVKRKGTDPEPETETKTKELKDENAKMRKQIKRLKEALADEQGANEDLAKQIEALDKN